jgi:hypothetical protein
MTTPGGKVPKCPTCKREMNRVVTVGGRGLFGCMNTTPEGRPCPTHAKLYYRDGTPK